MTIPLYPAAFPGSTVRIGARFTNSATGALEPLVGPVRFIISAPSGARTEGIAAAAADGGYELSWVPTESGRHVIYVRSAGPSPAVAEEEFVVRALQTAGVA